MSDEAPLRITFDQFRDWLLTKKVAIAPCPACGSAELAIHADETGNCVSAVTTGLAADRLRNFTDCRIICSNCGFLRLFAAKIIAKGVSP